MKTLCRMKTKLIKYFVPKFWKLGIIILLSKIRPSIFFVNILHFYCKCILTKFKEITLKYLAFFDLQCKNMSSNTGRGNDAVERDFRVGEPDRIFALTRR